MADTNLLPLADFRDLRDGTFVAIDLKGGRRLVGTFKGWLTYEYVDLEGNPTGGDTFLSLQLPNGAMIEAGYDQIAKVFYAPMGYRA